MVVRGLQITGGEGGNSHPCCHGGIHTFDWGLIRYSPYGTRSAAECNGISRPAEEEAVYTDAPAEIALNCGACYLWDGVNGSQGARRVVMRGISPVSSFRGFGEEPNLRMNCITLDDIAQEATYPSKAGGVEASISIDAQPPPMQGRPVHATSEGQSCAMVVCLL